MDGAVFFSLQHRPPVAILLQLSFHLVLLGPAYSAFAALPAALRCGLCSVTFQDASHKNLVHGATDGDLLSDDVDLAPVRQ